MDRKSFLIAILSFFMLHAFAQSDSTQVEILPGTKKQMFRQLPDGTSLQVLVGNVGLKQGTTLFYCDSVVVNNSTKIFEAFGNVHINDSDTAHLYSNYLRYLMDTRYAYLKGNVRLTDGHGTLTTNELEYDVASRIGTYKNGGRVVNNKSVLTSKEGIYYADIHDIYFSDNVRLKDPSYTLQTEALLYNTQSQVARFVAETKIRDSSGRTIQTREGYYDLKGKSSEFSQRTTIVDKDVTIIGDYISNNEATGISTINGNGVLVDKKNGVSILANEIVADKKKEAYRATKKPLMIIRQEKDSIYVAADTLYTARLSDLPEGVVFIEMGDTTVKKETEIKKEKQKEREKGKVPVKDSTDRYFEAYRNVRVFSDSVQSVSDSLFYSFRDSAFRLFQNPVVWSNKNQITGDTIFLYTRNKKAHKINVIENSLLVNEVQPSVYNQVRSTRIDGYFKDGTIDSVRAKGSAESIYYLQDKDSAYTGVNQTSSDIMDVYFRNGDLHKVVFRSAVKGTLWPISQKRPGELELRGFQWLDKRRPKTKYELFQ